MSDTEQGQNLLNHAHTNWILPEVERRRSAGLIGPEQFIISRCLILFPHEGNVIVKFNKEVSWVAEVDPDFDGQRDIKIGMDVFVHEMKQIIRVEPPEVDGKMAGFIFINVGESKKEIAFFFPQPEHDDDKWKKEWETSIEPHIRNLLHKGLIKKIIDAQKAKQNQLFQVSLWLAPSLMPYPLSKILALLEDGETLAATELLKRHCNTSFIKTLVEKWKNNPVFTERTELLSEALWAHENGKYFLSIHTLVPQVEGICSDWIISKLPPQHTPPFREVSKAEKFRDLLLSGHERDIIYSETVKSTVDMILGKLFVTFKKWIDPVDIHSFPVRHAVTHGRFDNSLYSEEHSIRLFLMIDSMYEFITKAS